MNYAAIGYERITVGTSFVKLSSGIYTKDALRAYLSCETTHLRWLITAGTPSTIDGHLMQALGDPVYLFGLSEIQNFRAISASTSNATLICSYSVLG